MTDRELYDAISRFGQERAARKLAIDSKLATPDEIALMACIDVCELLAKEFVMVSHEEGRITLVRKEDEEAYWKLVKCLDR